MPRGAPDAEAAQSYFKSIAGVWLQSTRVVPSYTGGVPLGRSLRGCLSVLTAFPLLGTGWFLGRVRAHWSGLSGVRRVFVILGK